MEPTDSDPCLMLPWDSKFFGINIARVKGDLLRADSSAQIDSWCKANGVKCLYFAARSDDAETVLHAERIGYHLVDVRMTFEHRKTPAPMRPELPDRFRIRRATPQDIPRLRQIAHSSHIDTRFFYDSHFPRQLCHSLYETWIQSSCDGFAQWVLVGEQAESLGGYLSCHVTKDGKGSIGLMAVDASHQGKGLGSALVASALAWFAEQGVRQVSVVTQGRNVAAQRLYVRGGFIPSKLELYYHRWY